jgi:catechol 2,3-dioxygenase-like lactoylglutathione lyase family enzyme
MSSALSRSDDATEAAHANRHEMRLEVVVIPVSDVDRSKRFYESLGWRLDGDFTNGKDFRNVQFTPPGSSCSIHFGIGVTSAAPGSAQRLYLVVSDILGARAELLARGIDVSEVVHRDGSGIALTSGRHPEGLSYSSFASFKDPDGNSWLLQEITLRRPGRMDSSETRFGSESGLAAALIRAAIAHGQHERRIGARDEGWPAWYASFLAAEQSGRSLPT